MRESPKNLSQNLHWHSSFRRSVLLFFALILGSLAIGVCGYHFTEGMSWIDSLLDASMILAGMGPVSELNTVPGKLFASFYAIFSGVVLLAASAVLLAPAFHAFLRKFHMDLDDEGPDEDSMEK